MSTNAEMLFETKDRKDSKEKKETKEAASEKKVAGETLFLAFTPDLIQALESIKRGNPKLGFISPKTADQYGLSNANLPSDLSLPCLVLFGDKGGMYAVGEILGQGSQGKVHRVMNLNTKEQFAAKFYQTRVGSGNYQERTTGEREIEFLKTLGLYVDQLLFKDKICVIETLADGQDLFHAIESRVKQFNKVEEKDIYDWLMQAKAALKALEHLHSFNIFHRDLKFNNVIFTKDGKCIIIDYGHAKKADVQDKVLGPCITFPEWGHPEYVSPDTSVYLVNGTGVGFNNRNTDIYSKGIMFKKSLEMLKTVCQKKSDKKELLAFIDIIIRDLVSPMLLTIKSHTVETLPSVSYFVSQVEKQMKGLQESKKLQDLNLKEVPDNKLAKEKNPCVYDLIKEDADPQVIVDLFKRNSGLIRSKVKENATPFMFAVKLGRLKIVQALLAFNASLAKHENPLGKAAKRGRYKIAKLLIETDKEIVTQEVIQAATDKEDSKMVLLLISTLEKVKQGTPNFNLSTIIGTTLKYAIDKKRVEIAWELIKAFQKYSVDDLYSILFSAISQNYITVIREWIQLKASEALKSRPIQLVTDKSTPSPKGLLYYAAQYNQPEALEFFISQGAKLSVTDCFHHQPLMIAAENGNIDCVSLLVQHTDANEESNGMDLGLRFKALEACLQSYTKLNSNQRKEKGQGYVKVILFLFNTLESPVAFIEKIIECFVSLDAAEELKELVDQHQNVFLKKVKTHKTLPKSDFEQPSFLQEKSATRLNSSKPLTFVMLNYESHDSKESHESKKSKESKKELKERKTQQDVEQSVLDKAILIAMEKRSLQSLALLISLKSDDEINNPIISNDPASPFQTLLNLAAQFNLPSIVELLIKRGAVVSFDSMVNAWNIALFYRSFEVAEMFLRENRVQLNPGSSFDFLMCCINVNNLQAFFAWFPKLRSQFPPQSNFLFIIFIKAIIQAGISKDESISEFLLSQEIEVDTVISEELTPLFGNSPIHLAVKHRLSAEFLSRLVKKSKPSTLELEDANGCSALLLSIVAGRIDLVEVLLQAGANPQNIISSRKVNVCRFDGRPQGVLPHTVVDPAKVTEEYLNGLGYAAQNNLQTILEVLLKAGSDPELKSKEGKLPSQYTENKNIKDLLNGAVTQSTLLKKIKSLDKAGQVDLLIRHLKAGDEKSILLILELDPTLINTRNKLGLLPAMYIIGRNDFSSNVIDEDDDKKEKKEGGENKEDNESEEDNEYENNEYEDEYANRNTKTLTLLVKKGLDLTLTAINGKTYLELAVDRKSCAHAIVFMKGGAPLDHIDEAGNTIFHKIMMMWQHQDLINYICDSNIPVKLLNHVNKFQRTPLDIAVQTQKYFSIIKKLMNKGLSWNSAAMYYERKSAIYFLWKTYQMDYIAHLADLIKKNKNPSTDLTEAFALDLKMNRDLEPDSASRKKLTIVIEYTEKCRAQYFAKQKALQTAQAQNAVQPKLVLTQAKLAMASTSSKSSIIGVSEKSDHIDPLKFKMHNPWRLARVPVVLD